MFKTEKISVQGYSGRIQTYVKQVTACFRQFANRTLFAMFKAGVTRIGIHFVAPKGTTKISVQGPSGCIQTYVK